jgi:PAS domain S-box-containing protein
MPVPNEPMGLIQELRSHQAELELQNERLRETEQQLSEAIHRYRELYDTAPVAYVTLDRRGRILEANGAAVAMLGMTRDDLLGVGFTRFMAEAQADRFHIHRWEVLCGTSARSIQLELSHPSGERFIARLASIGVRTPTGDVECRTAIIDVSREYRLETELSTRERLLNAILGSMSDGLISCDRVGNIEWTTASADELLGCSRAAVVGRSICDLFPELELPTRDHSYSATSKVQRGQAEPVALHIALHAIADTSFVAILSLHR